MRGIQLHVMSREEAEAYVPGEEEVCISISSFNPDHPYPMDSARPAKLSDKFDDVLRMVFDDIQPDFCEPHKQCVDSGQMKGYTEEDAEKVAEFIRKHINTKKKLVIHCYMGISRSRSIAAATAQAFFMKQKFDIYNVQVFNKTFEKLIWLGE